MKPSDEDILSQEDWEKLLEYEGMPSELPMIPRIQTRADVETYEQKPGVRSQTTLAYLNDARQRLPEIADPDDLLIWGLHAQGKSMREIAIEILRPVVSVHYAIARMRRQFNVSAGACS